VYYQPLEGRTRLFLSSNQLRRIPGEICNLENLQALSLRNNRLVELPTAIGKLGSLTEINMAYNNLHHLPYEILKLVSGRGRLARLIIHPNPFYVPIHPETIRAADLCTEFSKKDPETPVPNRNWVVEYKCRSQVRFFDKTGALIKGPAFPRDDSLIASGSQASNLEIPKAPPGDTAEPPTPSSLVNGREISRVPSLLEMAVKTWSKTPQLPDLDYWREEVPEGLPRLLNDAKALREIEAGDRKCTVCCRPFVIPRTEWIEWWELAERGLAKMRKQNGTLENIRDIMERVVPLMRRGCSWKCVPTAVPLHSEEGRSPAAG
jgi:Leucine-rich repeat (LRR) protein